MKNNKETKRSAKEFGEASEEVSKGKKALSIHELIRVNVLKDALLQQALQENKDDDQRVNQLLSPYQLELEQRDIDQSMIKSESLSVLFGKSSEEISQEKKPLSVHEQIRASVLKDAERQRIKAKRNIHKRDRGRGGLER